MKLHPFFSLFSESLNSFVGQKEGEEVITLLRRHPLTIYIRLGLLSFAALVPIFVGLIFYSLILNSGWFPAFLFVASLWYMALWLSAFHAITLYSLSTVLITNKRIIDSDQHGFFNREVSELSANRIQDVNAHTRGFIETFFKFGNVTVQTASSEREFIFHQVPHPEHVKDVIMQMSATHHTGIKATGKPMPPVNNLGI